MKEKKKIILSVASLVLLVVLVVGLTYAAFTFTKKGSKLNTITTAKISMSYTEGENGISIVDALPMSDEEGMVLSGTNQTFDFTVSAEFPSRGTTIGYEITAEKQDGSTLDDTDVKLYLERSLDNNSFTAVDDASNYIGLRESDEFGAGAGEMVLDTNVVNKTSTIYYKLRMWVDENYEASGESKSFAVKVNVYGSDTAINSKSYNVLVNTRNMSSSSSSVKLGYNATSEVTITPSEGFYLNEVSCTNGYTVEAMTGVSATNSQKIKIKNNGNTGKGTCTFVGKSIPITNSNFVNPPTTYGEVYETGTAVSYKVNDSTTQNFYILKDNGTTLTLITDSVVATFVAWDSSGDNSNGPRTATQSLENLTNSWTNIITNTYDESKGVATRARLITKEEAETVGCSGTENSCPTWLVDSSYWQWTSTPRANESSRAWLINASVGFISYGNFRVDYAGNNFGIRAVITVSK